MHSGTYLRQRRRRHTRKAVLGTYVSCALLRVRIAFAATTAEHATAERAKSPLRRTAGGRLGWSDPGSPQFATLNLPQSSASVLEKIRDAIRVIVDNFLFNSRIFFSNGFRESRRSLGGLGKIRWTSFT